jgi:hypothetical protein
MPAMVREAQGNVALGAVERCSAHDWYLRRRDEGVLTRRRNATARRFEGRGKGEG